VRLYQVTGITLVFVLFEGGWYILILPVGIRFSMFFALVFSTLVLGFFDVRRFCEDVEEVSLKMPWRPTAAIDIGARGLVERVSRRAFGSCMFFAHLRQPTRICRRVYRLSRGHLRSDWYRCVHDMHCPNGLNHSRSASPSSPTYVTAVDHDGIFSEHFFFIITQAERRKIFRTCRNTEKHEEGCPD